MQSSEFIEKFLLHSGHIDSASGGVNDVCGIVDVHLGDICKYELANACMVIGTMYGTGYVLQERSITVDVLFSCVSIH